MTSSEILPFIGTDLAVTSHDRYLIGRLGRDVLLILLFLGAVVQLICLRDLSVGGDLQDVFQANGSLSHLKTICTILTELAAWFV